jgi:hypothetical protein
MKFFKCFLPLVVAASLFIDLATLQAHENSMNERDFEAVESYLHSKRTMEVQEKSCNLTISGDIRTEWRHLAEKESCRRIRPGLDANDEPISKNEFDVEFNLYFDYVCDRAWGVVWLEFDNPAGVERGGSCRIDPEQCSGSGFCDELCLKKAYIGYNICCAGSTRIDVELGRRPLWTIFDSRIEFQSRFDGLLLKYSTDLDCFGDFYVNAGAFLIDERVNHFAYIVETGLYNIMDWGLDFKYSYVNWSKIGHGENVCGVSSPRGWQFRNSQWAMAYNFNSDMICIPARIYGAVLWNHAAKKREITNNQLLGLGWYVGFIIGEVLQEGDWEFDINYQVVQAQAISDCDLSGIGRGNALHETWTANGRGNANYKGWYVEGLYAVTNNLVIDTTIQVSKADQKDLNFNRDPHSFSSFEIEAIYAF